MTPSKSILWKIQYQSTLYSPYKELHLLWPLAECLDTCWPLYFLCHFLCIPSSLLCKERPPAPVPPVINTYLIVLVTPSQPRSSPNVASFHDPSVVQSGALVISIKASYINCRKVTTSSCVVVSLFEVLTSTNSDDYPQPDHGWFRSALPYLQVGIVSANRTYRWG